MVLSSAFSASFFFMQFVLFVWGEKNNKLVSSLAQNNPNNGNVGYVNGFQSGNPQTFPNINVFKLISFLQGITNSLTDYQSFPRNPPFYGDYSDIYTDYNGGGRGYPGGGYGGTCGNGYPGQQIGTGLVFGPGDVNYGNPGGIDYGQYGQGQPGGRRRGKQRKRGKKNNQTDPTPTDQNVQGNQDYP